MVFYFKISSSLAFQQRVFQALPSLLAADESQTKTLPLSGGSSEGALKKLASARLLQTAMTLRFEAIFCKRINRGHKKQRDGNISVLCFSSN